MSQHGHGAFTFLLAIALGALPWWITAVENMSWIAGKLVPIVALVVGLLQLWILVRKLIRRH
jgi:hypothetical protein